MAENVTPVVLNIKDFAPREVLLVNYKFNQTTDHEGQASGIVRGGEITIRVKALNDGNPELLGWMLDPAAPHDFTVDFQNTKDGSTELREPLEVILSLLISRSCQSASRYRQRRHHPRRDLR